MPLRIYKRSKARGAVYHAEGTIAGQRIRESTGCSSRSQAQAWAIIREKEVLDRHAFGTRATYTFAEAALDYMNAGGEARFLAPVLEYFGAHTLLSEVDNTALANLAADIYPTAKPATINRQLVVPVSAIVTRAAHDGKCDFRKFLRWKGDTIRTRWLTPAEMDALLFHAGDHLVPILAVLLGTGCRVSEALAAEVRHFHPNTGQIWLDLTKADSPRMLKMPARARDLILTRSQSDQGALLRNPHGAAYKIGKRGATPIKTAFHRARDAAGLGADVTPHVLRHTWATWYYAMTKDFMGLLDLGGWSEADMAKRYCKIAPDDLPDQLLAHGWDFTKLGRGLAEPGRSPVTLRKSDLGWNCQYPQPSQDPSQGRLRVVGA
jgi:integrase